MRIYASTRPLPVTKCHTERTSPLFLKRDVINEWPLSSLSTESRFLRNFRTLHYLLTAQFLDFYRRENRQQSPCTHCAKTRHKQDIKATGQTALKSRANSTRWATLEDGTSLPQRHVGSIHSSSFQSIIKSHTCTTTKSLSKKLIHANNNNDNTNIHTIHSALHIYIHQLLETLGRCYWSN